MPIKNSNTWRRRKSIKPYYSEARASIGTEAGELDIPSNWLDPEFWTLSLWFYGEPNNDANEQMYVRLVDGSGQAATVEYGYMDDIREEKWHQWNIPLLDFDPNVNLADVNKIIIGFGEESETPRGQGTVYFEDIQLSMYYPPKPHTARVTYSGRLTGDWWNVWNIPFTQLAGVNMANVKSIAIGFGDGNAPYVHTGTGTVYFDDIILGHGNAKAPGNPPTDVNLTDDPFVRGYDHYPLLLKQDCPLIEAGGGYDAF